MARRKGRSVSGVLLLDKPTGMSSNHALQRVKRLFGAAKAGHTGALDPLATGLLPICLGEATKYSQYLLDADKGYRTTAKLGVRTDSCDADGVVIEQRPVQGLSVERVEALLKQHFTGEIEQVPPVFSALKLNGQPLYKLARQGIQVEVKPRRVKIHSARLLALRDDEIDLEIFCSKGTYIRSIVEDLGLLLGCGAHVSALRRLQSGHFLAEDMLTLEKLAAIAATSDPAEQKESAYGALDALLLPPWSALDALPRLYLLDSDVQALQQGRAVESAGACGEFLLFDQAETSFFGLVERTVDGVIRPRRLMQTS